MLKPYIHLHVHVCVDMNLFTKHEVKYYAMYSKKLSKYKYKYYTINLPLYLSVVGLALLLRNLVV